jgi:hypothetical protein
MPTTLTAYEIVIQLLAGLASLYRAKQVNAPDWILSEISVDDDGNRRRCGYYAYRDGLLVVELDDRSIVIGGGMPYRYPANAYGAGLAAVALPKTTDHQKLVEQFAETVVEKNYHHQALLTTTKNGHIILPKTGVFATAMAACAEDIIEEQASAGKALAGFFHLNLQAVMEEEPQFKDSLVPKLITRIDRALRTTTL